MKKRVLKKWVKDTLNVLALILIMLVLIKVVKLNNELKQVGLNGCLESGYSYSFCTKHS
jgi:hypothetical protein